MSRMKLKRIAEKLPVYAICLGLILAFIGDGSIIAFSDNYIFYLAAMLLAAVSILTRNKLSLPDPIIYWSMLGFLVCTLLVGGLSSHTDAGTFKTMIMASGLTVLMLFTKHDRSDVKKIENSIMIGSVILSVLILFFGGHYLSAATGKYTYIQSFGDKNVFEPNFTAFFLTMGFEIAAVRLMEALSDKRTRSLIIFFAAAVIQMIAMLRTGSRLSLVAAVIFILAYLLFTKNVRLKKYAFIAVAFAGILLIMAALAGLIPESIMTRLFSSSYLDGSNMKRISDWIYGAKAMMSNVFGFGPVVTSDIIYGLFGFSGDAHNTFISIGIFYGPIVFTAFVGLWGYMLLRLLQYKEEAYAAMFVSLFFQANILPLQCTVTLWIFMLLVFMLICQHKREINKTLLEKKD